MFRNQSNAWRILRLLCHVTRQSPWQGILSSAIQAAMASPVTQPPVVTDFQREENFKDSRMGMVNLEKKRIWSFPKMAIPSITMGNCDFFIGFKMGFFIGFNGFKMG